MRKNSIFLCSVLLLALALWAWQQHGRGGAHTALITLTSGAHYRLPLENDSETFYPAAQTGAALDFTIQIQDGRARFLHSVCPDHICENTGWLSLEHEQAICLPAGVVLTVE